jgi:hypothetical protein
MMTPAEMAEIVSSNTFPNLYKLLNIPYKIPIIIVVQLVKDSLLCGG